MTSSQSRIETIAGRNGPVIQRGTARTRSVAMSFATLLSRMGTRLMEGAFSNMLRQWRHTIGSSEHGAYSTLLSRTSMTGSKVLASRGYRMSRKGSFVAAARVGMDMGMLATRDALSSLK